MVLSKDEFIFAISIIALAFLILLMFFLLVIVLNGKIRKQKEIQKLEAVLETQESERKRIAEDLHDEIGPMLSAIKLRMSSFTFSQTTQELETNIKETSTYLDIVIKNVRSIVRNLTPLTISNNGLIQSIEEFRDSIEKSNRATFSFVHLGIIGKWKTDAEAAIYRIVSEMINNSLRHSNCDHIDLVLRMYSKSFLLMYIDNGTISANGKIQSEGNGLKNIASRVRLLNGEIISCEDFTKGAFYSITFENNKIIQPVGS